MKIYIGCALTQVPRQIFGEYAAFLHSLAAALTASGEHEAKYALVNSDPQLAEKPAPERARLCYLWDRRMVEEAELLIAEASFPSLGLGIEIQLAESRNIPIVLCYRDFGMNRAAPVTYENPDHKQHELQIGDGSITLMALGVPTVLRVVHYTNPANGIEQIKGAVRDFDID
jgi:hypothetical protein